MSNCPNGEMVDYPQIVEQALDNIEKVIKKASIGDMECQELLNDAVNDNEYSAQAFYNLIDSCLPAFRQDHELNDFQRDILLKNAIDFIYAYRQGLIDNHEKWEHLV